MAFRILIPTLVRPFLNGRAVRWRPRSGGLIPGGMPSIRTMMLPPGGRSVLPGGVRQEVSPPRRLVLPEWVRLMVSPPRRLVLPAVVIIVMSPLRRSGIMVGVKFALTPSCRTALALMESRILTPPPGPVPILRLNRRRQEENCGERAHCQTFFMADLLLGLFHPDMPLLPIMTPGTGKLLTWSEVDRPGKFFVGRRARERRLLVASPPQTPSL